MKYKGYKGQKTKQICGDFHNSSIISSASILAAPAQYSNSELSLASSCKMELTRFSIFTESKTEPNC